MTAKDALLAQKSNEVNTLTQLNGSLSEQLLALQSKLQNSQLDSALKAKLEADLADTQRLLSAASDEVARLKAQFANVPDASDLAAALEQVQLLRSQLSDAPSQAELVKLENENRALRQELATLKSATNRSRLFAEKAELLSENGQRLFKRLVSLEGVTNSERLSVYSSLKRELNARVVETVGFASGSATVNVEKSAVIQQSLLSTAPNAEYLVVGYASQSGDAASNRELSAQRATAVATLADIERGATQTVKAVFLGQTSRFSSSDERANQICEVWEIIPE